MMDIPDCACLSAMDESFYHLTLVGLVLIGVIGFVLSFLDFLLKPSGKLFSYIVFRLLRGPLTINSEISEPVLRIDT